MEPLERAVRSALREAWAVLLPISCPGCGEPDTAICPRCASSFAGSVVRELPTEPPSIAHAAATYDGVARALVIAAKEVGTREVLRVCGRAFARLLAEHPVDVVAIVPPSRAGTVRRGFTPLAAMLATQHIVPLRLRMRDDGQQKLRSRADRRGRSLEAPASSVPRIAGGTVAILDDVVTSGATLAAASSALRHAGALGVVPLALASARLRGQSDHS